MDPLELLQSSISKDKKIEQENGNIVIGSYAFPEKTYTCMKKLAAYEKHESIKESSYYTLDCVFFFWTVFSKNPDHDFVSYAELCGSQHIDPISYVQIKPLLNFLKKKSDSCIYFDKKASFRYVKPISTGLAADATEGAITIGTYKRMREIIGNEKIYKTRSKMINLEGSASFLDTYKYLDREEKKIVKHDEDWKGRMNMNIDFNLEEGFLTQKADLDTTYTKEAIIIVPPSVGMNIVNMYNIEEFAKGHFVSSDEVKKKQPLKPKEVVISHTINNHKMNFRFIDNVNLMKKEDWYNVVCVITGSQAWQFNGWKYPNPTDLFSRYLGVFIWFSDSPVPPTIKQWNVKVVTLSRDVRNMDAVASIQLWDLVEKEIKTRKTNLLK